MSLFKSKRGRRNIRKKAVELEEEGAEGENEGTEATEVLPTNGETPSQPNVSTAPTKKKETKSSLLSFEDELADEGPEFRVKKTTLSRRAAKMAEKGKKEKKHKKKRATLDEVMEGGGSGDESEEEEEEEEGTGPLVSLSQQLREGCFIPNAEFIHRARREREERRQMGDGGGGGGAPGFMALSTSKKKVPTATGKSRLVREDDNDKSDESGGEDGGRRRMDGGTHDMAAVKQFQVLQGLEEMGSDEDEETKRWEEEQILKGVKASAPDQLTTVNPGSSHLSMLDQSFLMGTAGYGNVGTSYMTPSYVQAVQAYAGITPQGVASETPPTGGSSGTAGTTKNSFRIPEKLVPITLESLKSRLSNRLRDLQDGVSGHRERLGQIRADLERSREEVGVAESKRGDLGARYQYYQEIRGYLRDLLSCLGEKEPQISSMERAVRKVRKERADLLLERRRQDITDQDRECSQTDSVVKVPGSQEVVAGQRRAVEREGRRRRRREGRERGEGREREEHRQGLSTDDELLEMNRLKFENNMTKALAGAESVFEEVVEEFCQVAHIKTKLEEWKFVFPDSYSLAHVPLYLPQLFAPFARLELLRWNPLEDNCPDFEAMQWFEVLMFYGFREGEELDLSDPDTRLLPELVDRVIVTKLTILVQSVWDPLSSSQTRKLTSLLRQLASDYPSVSSEHRNTQSLFSSVLSRLRRATQDDVLIPLYTRAQVENSLSPHAVFYNQQFWSCVKLLGNITEWEGLVSPDALQELVLDGLLNKYMVLSLQTCPCSNLSVIKTGAIISRLPVTWLADGATVTRPLQGLVIYLTHLAQQLLQASIGHPDHLRLKTRSLVKEISGQLARLGATSESQSLCP